MVFFMERGGSYMSEEQEKSLNSALASARMEGFQITPQIEENCRKIVNGELSISDYIRLVTAVNAPQTGEPNVV